MALVAPYDNLVGATSDGVLPPVVMKHLQVNSSGSSMQEDAAKRIAAALDLEHPVRIGVVGDSTSNDGNDWPRVLMLQLRNEYPKFRFEYDSWDNSAMAFRAKEIMQAGGGGASTGGLIFNDTFSRTGNINGSKADTGQTWSGSASALTTDGSKARFSTYGSYTATVGAKDGTLTSVVDVVTSAPSGLVNARMGIGVGAASVYAQLTLTTAGVFSIYLYKIVGGTTTQIGLGDMSSIVTPNSASVQSVTIELTLQIQNVSCKVTTSQGSTTITGVITESDYTSLGQAIALTSTSAVAPNFAFDSLALNTPSTSKPVPLVYMINTSIAGGSFQNQVDNYNTFYPASRELDVLMIGMGHNYGSNDATYQLQEFEKFITPFKVDHPDTSIFVYSQNPQAATMPSPDAHVDRQYAMRRYAQKNWMSYAPVLEAFRKRSDGGSALLTADGIHPTTPGSNVFAGEFGSVLWATTVKDTIYKQRG